MEAGVLGPIGKHLLDRPLGLFGGRPDVFHITASARAPLYPDEPLRIVAAVGKDDDVKVADHGPRIAAGTGPPDDLFERRGSSSNGSEPRAWARGSARGSTASDGQAPAAGE